jgi:hypothetical protein
MVVVTVVDFGYVALKVGLARKTCAIRPRTYRMVSCLGWRLGSARPFDRSAACAIAWSPLDDLMPVHYRSGRYSTKEQ